MSSIKLVTQSASYTHARTHTCARGRPHAMCSSGK